MTTRKLIAAIAVATGLLLTGAVAQQEEQHQDQAAKPPDSAGAGKMGNMACCSSMPGMQQMMPGMQQMMPGMHQMMMSQNETSKLVDQLVKSLAAIEAEKNPKELKKKLAEHGALLKELQTKVQDHSHMMDQHMGGMMMMGGEHKQ